jgi:3-methyladenine DNA glycosylase AlkD
VGTAIAIIATMALLREREIDEALRISQMLLGDEHDLIHKAVGWALARSVV